MAPHTLNLTQPKGRELLGGDLVAQSLKQLGVEVAFGLHGGHLDAVLMGCVDVGIELVDTRHETVAVQAAEGYAKVSGKTGVAFVTANSGFCNGFPGLATAFADRSPIFVITSSPPLRDAETNALQGFHDQVVLARPVTKFCHRITNVGEIPRLVSLAWRTASCGAPGPVLLDFPIDVLFTPVDTDSVAWGSITAPPVSAPGPDPSAIATALQLLSTASRPVIVVGTGSRAAVAEITAFAEKTAVPIFHTPKFSTAVPHAHALHAGSALNLGLLAATSQPQPDLVLILGARTGFLLGGRSGAVIPAQQDSTIIQIDTDGSEIGRSSHIALGIVSDIKLAVAALLASSLSYKAPEEWTCTALALKTHKAPHNEAEPVIDPKNGNLHPYHALKSLFLALPPNSILAIDGGEAGGWALQLLPSSRAALSLVATGYLGFLGNGWGYALGAAIADRSKLVVNVQGDGSAGFHIAELDTYARFGCRVLTVVVNNSVWGMSCAGQEMLYGHLTASRPAATLKAGTRYDLVSEGFGVKGVLVDATKENVDAEKALDSVRAAVEEVLRGDGPGLIDLRVSDRPWQDMTMAMVGATSDPDVIVVPYYDNLPRPYYKGKGE